MQPGETLRLLTADHGRLDDLLRRAVRDDGSYDLETYGRFRAGLLSHIKLEETTIFPALQSDAGPPSAVARLRRDHVALAALTNAVPSPAIVQALRSILAGHNALEEGGGGVYEMCDRLPAELQQRIVQAAAAAKDIPVPPYKSGPAVDAAIRRALHDAGYAFDGADGTPPAPADGPQS